MQAPLSTKPALTRSGCEHTIWLPLLLPAMPVLRQADQLRQASKQATHPVIELDLLHRHRMAECRTALRLAAALSGGQGLTGLSVSGPEGNTCFQGRVCLDCAAHAAGQSLLCMLALLHARGRPKHALETHCRSSLCWDAASATSQCMSHQAAQTMRSSPWGLSSRRQGVHGA